MKFAGRRSKWWVTLIAAVCWLTVMPAPGTLLAASLEVDEELGNSPYQFWGFLSKDNITIGTHGQGTFRHWLGITSVKSTLALGAQNGSYGTYDLLLGWLRVQNEILGLGGTGYFRQIYGLHTIKKDLTLGSQSGSHGIYDLRQGGLTVGGNEYIGYEGTGKFTQTGGSHKIAGTLTLAAKSGGSGTYDLLGGDLSAKTIEVKQGGTFNITGVDNKLTTTVTGDLILEGFLKVTNANLTWDGLVTIAASGLFKTDPSQVNFLDDVKVAGAIQASPGDVLVLHQDLIFEGEHASANLNQSTVVFGDGSGAATVHTIKLPATVKIDTLKIEEGDSIKISNGSLNVRDLEGLVIDPQNNVIKNIISEDGSNIIYDQASNPELGGKIYSLTNGGTAIPTPIPASFLLLATGFLGLVAIWRRQHQKIK